MMKIRLYLLIFILMKRFLFIFILILLPINFSIAEIKFKEILENPGDLKLNLKYALEQESLGQYKATLATLERLNMLYPVNSDIKLYLISILLKMDSVAKLQLMVETMLVDPNTTQETRDYIEEILKTIRQQSKPESKWFAYMDINYSQTEHSNIDGVSKTKKLFRLNNTEDFPGLEYDKAFSRGSSLTIGKNLDPTSSLSFNGGVSINTQNKGPENENDITSGSVSYSKILGKHYLIPYIFYNKINQRTEHDLATKGFGFNNTYNIDTNNSISYSSSLSFTDYNRTSSKDAEIANDKNNNTFTTSVGYNHAFLEKNLISSKISYFKRDAKFDANKYKGPSLNIGYTRLLPFGNLNLSRTFSRYTYDEKDDFIHSSIDRKDDLIISQIQLSGRINKLFPFLEKIDPKGQFFYVLNYTDTDSDSSLLNNSAKRKTSTFNLIKRFSLYE